MTPSGRSTGPGGDFGSNSGIAFVGLGSGCQSGPQSTPGELVTHLTQEPECRVGTP